MYADYIARLEGFEEDRKDSIERRGVAVITTAGALATLLLGLVALARGTDSRLDLPEAADRWLVVALIAFFLAALFAVGTNVPLRYQGANLANLHSFVVDDEETEREARQIVTKNRLDVLTTTTSLNGWKARALVAAMSAEVIALGAIAYIGWLALE